MHFALHVSDGIEPGGESHPPDGPRGEPSAPVAFVGSAVPVASPSPSPSTDVSTGSSGSSAPAPSPAETAAAAEAARRALAEAADGLPPGVPRPGLLVPGRSDPLTALREAVRARYRWVLTAEEAIVHRRLLNAGRIAEARALVEQAERFFLTARQALALMHEDELVAFERAIDREDPAQRTRIVAAALRRDAREASNRLVEAPRLTQALDPFAGAEPHAPAGPREGDLDAKDDDDARA